ncbi:MAG: hypothetical protein FD119_2634 [Stygiobacter sp.]|nr:MAG: hypothetical protein FD119_2634 [Stygiobacter sp.]
MQAPVVNFAAENMVRRTPDHIVAMDQADLAYIRDSLTDVGQAFGIAALPDIPLHLLPARALMRRLVDLRTSLKPQTLEQGVTLGRLAGAILRLDTAVAFDKARRK